MSDATTDTTFDGDTVGMPTVLIPSLGGSARLFETTVRALWRAGPVTIADHRRDDSIADVAAHILTTAPPTFALAGLSMGGYIAFEILRRAPERVKRLVLLDTSARVDTAAERDDRIEQRSAAMHGDFDALADKQFPHTVAPPHRGDATLRATFRAMMSETGADAFIRQQTACIDRIASLSTLSRIRCPTLVVVGADDGITPIDHAREMADGIVGAELVVVPTCGHLSTIDQPDAVTRLWIDWLDRKRGQ